MAQIKWRSGMRALVCLELTKSWTELAIVDLRSPTSKSFRKVIQLALCLYNKNISY